MFGKKKPTTASGTTPVSTEETKTMQLTKGNRFNLTKTGAPVIVKNGWVVRGKDYDLKALVRFRDDRAPLYIGAANLDEVLTSPEGAVRHGGDARNAGELETITIKWHPDIASVALSSYSALENGVGSFREYGVYVEIVNGPQVVRISAADASADGTSYTLCFGEVVFESNGSLTIVNNEMYSSRDSENRIGYQGGRIVMDIGPCGQTK